MTFQLPVPFASHINCLHCLQATSAIERSVLGASVVAELCCSPQPISLVTL
jgi:hypothetical protein